MTDPLLLAAALAIAIIAAFTQGVTGFGFVMVAAPLMSALADPRLVVPALIVQTSATNALILLHAWRHVRVRRIWLLGACGMAGVPAGAVVLLRLDAGPLRLIIGTIVLMAAIAMLMGFRRRFGNERAASVPVGFLSGALNSSTGLSAPPIVLFFTNQHMDPREFRANAVAHFMMLNVVTVPAFIIGGLFTADALRFSAQLLPATLIGVLAGIAVSQWVRASLFQRLALVLVVLAGATAAVAGVSSL